MAEKKPNREKIIAYVPGEIRANYVERAEENSSIGLEIEEDHGKARAYDRLIAKRPELKESSDL